MKRIRWKGELQWDDGEGTPLRSDTSEIFYTDYTGSEWAEITEAIYDFVPGRILLKVKEPEKPVSLVDAVKRHLGTLLTVFREEPLRLPHLKELVEAMDREEASPPKRLDDGRIPQELLDAIDPSAVHGGTRAILLVGDGGWAVKDFPAGVDTGKVELWCGPSVMESRCNHDRVKPKEAAK